MIRQLFDYRRRLDIEQVTDEQLDLAKVRLFWQQLEVGVLSLGGDPARARAVVEYLVATSRQTPESARQFVFDELAEGRELSVHPGNS